MPILVDKIMIGNEEVDKVIIQGEVIYQKQTVPSLPLPYTLWEGTIFVGNYFQVWDIPFELPDGFAFPANVRITTQDFGDLEITFNDNQFKTFSKWLTHESEPSYGEYYARAFFTLRIDDDGIHFNEILLEEGLYQQDAHSFNYDMVVTKIEVIE